MARSTNSSSTSPSLIARARQQDRAAWQRLVDLYGPLVFHWCRRQGLTSHDAADVMQDVFAAVSRGLDGFWKTRESGTFRGWLWTITRNKVIDFHRRNQHAPAAAGGSVAAMRIADLPAFSDDSLDCTDPREMTRLFHRALDLVRGEFEERTWRAFWRATVDEEPTAEIAADMGITANAVRQAKSRVLRRLRLELGDDYAIGAD